MISLLVLLKLGFNVYLAKNNIELSFRITYCVSSYVLNGFIAMDTNNYECNLIYSMIMSLYNSKIDANLWHTWLGHIGQHQMDRLAKQGLPPNYEKVDLSACEHFLTSKSNTKPFGKGTKENFPL